MNQSPSHRRPIVAAIGVTVVLLAVASFLTFGVSWHGPPPSEIPSFDLTWQRGVKESTARFQAEIERIGADRELSDEQRQAAMIVAQDRHAAEMDQVNMARMAAVQVYQRKSMMRALAMLTLPACGAAVILWIVFRNLTRRRERFA